MKVHQVQSHPKTRGILTKALCTFDLNLVILAWMGHKCTYKLRVNTRTDVRTDSTQRQAKTIPKGQSWPRVKSAQQRWVDLNISVSDAHVQPCAGLILGLRPANERRRYKVTPSLIGWAQMYNQPCMWCMVYLLLLYTPSVIIHTTQAHVWWG